MKLAKRVCEKFALFNCASRQSHFGLDSITNTLVIDISLMVSIADCWWFY